MPRINIFENYPLHAELAFSSLQSNGFLRIQGVFIPGSLSFNTVAFLMSASGTTAKTLTISFGLYSLTGSTLSLANSASQSSNPVANQGSWVTLVTSATQDITPGNWYLAEIYSTSNNGNISLLKPFGVNPQVTHAGAFFRGYYSATTSAFPASIATSDLRKEGAATGVVRYIYNYILISA